VVSQREAFAEAARSAAGLIALPAVAAAWSKPSALAEFSVSGLTGHLAAQVLNVPLALSADVAGEQPISLLDHYGSVQWIEAGVDAEINVGIREGGERIALVGPQALAQQVSDTASDLRERLAQLPADHVVRLPWTGWCLRLDDFLVTRMMEIAVHSDDLAVSVGIATPDLPPHVLDPVLALLTSLAAGRHGQPAVLRALSRAERAPVSITAF